MLSLEEAKEAAKGFCIVPISREILSDIKTPMEVLRILKRVSSHCYILESVENQEKWGRYTFLGFEPTMEITCTNGMMRVKNGKEVETSGNCNPQHFERLHQSEDRRPAILYRWSGRIFFL